MKENAFKIAYTTLLEKIRGEEGCRAVGVANELLGRGGVGGKWTGAEQDRHACAAPHRSMILAENRRVMARVRIRVRVTCSRVMARCFVVTGLGLGNLSALAHPPWKAASWQPRQTRAVVRACYH